ncbi:MAG TPA: glycosyltransferase family 9 protein, partial [Candidatus Synoicihabitans sp.]|nr:glycosyltransferase family 9 protein [Candidatus Synoicihabitans sp.]
TTHQVALWAACLRHFGLEQPISHEPLPRPTPADRAPIGLIAGSENTPAKRWPVAHWRALVAALPQERFVLFGTANDRAITSEIARGFGDERIEDLAGGTDLPQYMERLRGCALLVSNDTGGMHLANALGVPVVALFGPTNPLRTGPTFEAVRVILQPPGCAPTGGADLAQLEPSVVVDAIARLRAGSPAVAV